MKIQNGYKKKLNGMYLKNKATKNVLHRQRTKHMSYTYFIFTKWKLWNLSFE